MITRRRFRGQSSVRMEPKGIQVEEEVEKLQSPPMEIPADDTDPAGIKLDDLLEDIKWTLESDYSLPLFDVDFSEPGFYTEHDTSLGVSAASSPERATFNTKMQNRKKQFSHVNKNAIAARLNRQKKKEYITGLEKKTNVLTMENAVLKQENSLLNKRVEDLEDETRYLRAVLANQSMLAQLLSRLSGVNGMKLSSSLLQAPDTNEHDYSLPRKRVKVEEKETSGGVCLHVDRNHVSVEFCTKCAASASTSLKM